MKEGQDRNTESSDNTSEQLKQYREEQARRWQEAHQKNSAVDDDGDSNEVSNNNNTPTTAPISHGKEEIENDNPEDDNEKIVLPTNKITRTDFLNEFVNRLRLIRHGMELLVDYIRVSSHGYEIEDGQVIETLQQMQLDFDLSDDDILEEYFNLSEKQHIQICEEILKRKDVDINYQEDEERITALHKAVENNQLEIVQFLLQKKCDITLATSMGYSNDEGLAFSLAVSEGNIEIALIILAEAKARNMPKEYYTQLLVDLFYLSRDGESRLRPEDLGVLKVPKFGMCKNSPTNNKGFIEIVKELLLCGANLNENVYDVSRAADESYSNLTVFDLAKKEKGPNLEILIKAVCSALLQLQSKYVQTPRQSALLLNNSILLKNRELGCIKLIQVPQNDVAEGIIYHMLLSFDTASLEKVKTNLPGKWLDYTWKQTCDSLNCMSSIIVELFNDNYRDYIKNIYSIHAVLSREELTPDLKENITALLLIEASDEIFIEMAIKYNLVVNVETIRLATLKIIEIIEEFPHRINDIFMNKNVFIISLILWLDEIPLYVKQDLLFSMLLYRQNLIGVVACYQPAVQKMVQTTSMQPNKLESFRRFFEDTIFKDWKKEIIGSSSTQPTVFYNYLCDKINLQIAETKQSNSNDEKGREFPGNKRKQEDVDSENQEKVDASHTMELG